MKFMIEQSLITTKHVFCFSLPCPGNRDKKTCYELNWLVYFLLTDHMHEIPQVFCCIKYKITCTEHLALNGNNVYPKKVKKKMQYS